MHLFWKQGCAATSIADLTRAMNINTGSLYSTFGRKHDLFVRALRKYDEDGRQAYLAQLNIRENPIEAISAFFDIVAAETAADRDRMGCFMVNTAVDYALHAPDIQATVSTAFCELESFFIACLRRAKSLKLVAASVDEDAEAAALLQKLIGIRVLARSGAAQ